MIKKIHVLIALYSLISHSVESVATEPEGVEPRRVLTLQQYSDLPPVLIQFAANYFSFYEKQALCCIDKNNSKIIDTKYKNEKDENNPFLKLRSLLSVLLSGIRENNSAVFGMYVSPKLSVSDSVCCLQFLCMQGFSVRKNTI